MRVMADGSYVKVYVNGKRIANASQRAQSGGQRKFSSGSMPSAMRMRS